MKYTLDSTIIIFLGILALINVASAVVCVYDKQRAIWGGWRVSEGLLMLLAIAGGATAMYITMLRIKHKTRHMKFMIGLPVIIAVQAVLIVFVVSRLL